MTQIVYLVIYIRQNVLNNFIVVVLTVLFSYKVCGRCVQCKNCGKRTAGEVSCLLPLNYFVD